MQHFCLYTQPCDCFAQAMATKQSGVRACNHEQIHPGNRTNWPAPDTHRHRYWCAVAGPVVLLLRNDAYRSRCGASGRVGVSHGPGRRRRGIGSHRAGYVCVVHDGTAAVKTGRGADGDDAVDTYAGAGSPFAHTDGDTANANAGSSYPHTGDSAPQCHWWRLTSP